jgi:hypothetical protein
MPKLVRGHRVFGLLVISLRQAAWAGALAVTGCAICPSVRAAVAQCKLGRLAEFAITTTDLRPLVTARGEVESILRKRIG